MKHRPEFLALVHSDKDLFKKELFTIIESKISKKVSEKKKEESLKIVKNAKPKPKKEIKENVEQPKQYVNYMPVSEINLAINNNRTCWLTAKDGSQLEISPKMATYLAELYKSLNTSHKDKLIVLMTESEHGFKKALNTAERLYGDKNEHK